MLKITQMKNLIISSFLIVSLTVSAQFIENRSMNFGNMLSMDLSTISNNVSKNILNTIFEIEVEEEDEKKPELLSSPRNGKKDALTKIKGLGPKLEEKLNEAGIFHFDQIASWTEADFEWLRENTTFAGRAKKDDWVSQAKTFI